MMRYRLRLAALATTLLIFAGSLVAVMPGQAAAYADPAPSVDYVLELQPGEDLDHWVDFALDMADVDEEDRPARIVYKYEEAINGAWLKLTQAEAHDIDGIRGRDGVRSLTRSWDMTAQWLEDDVIVAGSDGRVPAWPDELVPAGVQRVDGGRDVDYSDVHVGIIDTAIDRFHEDLNVVGGFDCTFDGHADDWGDGGHMHATHVGGIVGAKRNGRGVKGVAPNASLHGYKTLSDSGSGSYAAILCGVDRGMIDDVDVMNLSLGGGNGQSVCDSWDSLHTAICNATSRGIAVVVAAGNDTSDALTKSPANYPEAITVSALATFGTERPGTNVPQFGVMDYPQADNELAWFSNHGSLVDVIAPGVAVLSTVPGNSYGVASGTSMASPHAAGVIAANLAQQRSETTAPVNGVTAAGEVRGYSADYNAQWGGDVDYDHEPLVILPLGDA